MSRYFSPSDPGPYDRARKFDVKDLMLEREITVTLSGQWSPEQRRGILDKILWGARSWARVYHPHVAALYDLGGDEQHLYIVTDRHKGRSLQNFLDGSPEGHSLSPTDVRILIEAVASVLQYAHGYGISHGELCPEQILLSPGRRVQVLRYAPEVLDLRTSDRLWEKLPSLAFYQSPQQTVGFPATQADDIYALGMLLYRLTTGAYPFSAASLPMFIDQVLTRIPDDVGTVSGYPRNVGSVIARCLEKNPEARFASVEELVRCLYPDMTLPTVDAARVRDLDRAALQFLQQKRFEEALSLWRDAVAIDPGNGRLMNNLGVALCRLERWKEAEDAFRKATECLAFDGYVYFHLGWVLWKLDLASQAQIVLKQAIRFQPRLIEAYLLLGLLTQGRDRLDYLQMAAMVRPKSRPVHLALAEALLSDGRQEEAYKYREYAQNLPLEKEEIKPRHMRIDGEDLHSSEEGEWPEAPPDDRGGGVSSPRKPPPKLPGAGEAQLLPSE